MKFRKTRQTSNSDEDARRGNDQEATMRQQEPARGIWSTTFLIAGSALAGATALALWNRRTITSLRAQIQAQSELVVSSSSINEEIY